MYEIVIKIMEQIIVLLNNNNSMVMELKTMKSQKKKTMESLLNIGIHHLISLLSIMEEK
jgi:hypothetical protein